jgi:D-aminoacyl-tRNA deacylase
MKIAIVTFKTDPASMNIRQCILEEASFKECFFFDSNPVMEYKGIGCKNDIRLYLLNSNSIEADNADSIDCDILIFATKHASSSEKKSLCVHAPGNWAKNELYGKERNLCISPALLIKEAFLKLKKYNLEGYDVSVEQTHHGPFVSKPIMFIEIGSNLRSWLDKKAGRVLARTILHISSSSIPESRCVVLFGGGHYNQGVNKILEKTEFCVGHSCAKYNIPYLTKDVIMQSIEKSIPKASLVILDWKSLGNSAQRKPLLEVLEDIDIEVKRLKDI